MKQSLFIPSKLSEYEDLAKWFDSLKQRSESEWIDAMRWYAQNDLFWLVNRILSFGNTPHSHYGTPFYWHQHYVDACRLYEYQLYEAGRGIDVSGRGSGKSTIRTHAGAIQLMLRFPNISIFIFSKTLQLADKHMIIIKTELEQNALLKYLFPDILYEDPLSAVKNMETMWAADKGIRVRRTMNRITQTLERHAFYGGGPVGTRPDVVLFDDCEDADSVATPEKIKGLRDAFSNAVTLLTPVVIPKPIIMVSNTRFSEGSLIESLYTEYLALDPKTVRAFPGEDLTEEGDGPLGGTARYPFTNDILVMRYDNTPNKAEYALQFALDYRAGEDAKLRTDNLIFTDEDPRKLGRGKNCYITIDASRGIYDPTAICVIGLGSDKRYYWLDAHVEKLDPSQPEFYNAIFLMLSKWENICNRVVEVRVEQMGGSAWADMIRHDFERRGCYTKVVACRAIAKKSKDFTTGKAARIFERWAPMVNNGLFIMPQPAAKGGYGLMMTDKTGKTTDVVDYFLTTEFNMFPRSKHDDILDSIALMHDQKANEEAPLQWVSPASLRRGNQAHATSGKPAQTSWMSAFG